MVKLVPERLRDAAKLFEERNAAYGSNYLEIGPVLHAMFPDGLVVDTPEVWTRVFFLVHRMTKETRYAKNIRKGGHADSLDDLSVYAIMNAETDDIAREDRQLQLELQDPAPTGLHGEVYEHCLTTSDPILAGRSDPVFLRETDEWRTKV